jgi:hypothetical protein
MSRLHLKTETESSPKRCALNERAGPWIMSRIEILMLIHHRQKPVKLMYRHFVLHPLSLASIVARRTTSSWRLPLHSAGYAPISSLLHANVLVRIANKMALRKIYTTYARGVGGELFRRCSSSPRQTPLPSGSITAYSSF